jgi:hypothetical protein
MDEFIGALWTGLTHQEEYLYVTALEEEGFLHLFSSLLSLVEDVVFSKLFIVVCFKKTNIR